jgi:peptide deformylase
MAILRQIAQLGHPLLRAVAASIPDPRSPEILALIDDMLATLAESGGVGIAGPQVYAALRVIVVASRPTARYPDAPQMEAQVLVNPELLWVSKEMEDGWEGCLSVPGLRGKVARHAVIGVRARMCLPGTNEWQSVERDFRGFPARIFQHELDHLEGKVFLDRVADSRDFMSDKEYLRQIH